LKAAIALEPDDAAFWYQQGMTWLNLGDYSAAQASLVESLKAEAYHHRAWLAFGLTLQRLGCYQDAIEAYNKALAIEPDIAFAFYHQACCYAVQGQHDWALEHLRRAIALSPQLYLKRAETEPALGQLRAQRPTLLAATVS
ncbi:MAG: tetratricopeptide repeat protein, partial [Cyanobacteria bacterium P01_C01_bin.73]